MVMLIFLYFLPFFPFFPAPVWFPGTEVKGHGTAAKATRSVEGRKEGDQASSGSRRSALRRG